MVLWFWFLYLLKTKRWTRRRKLGKRLWRPEWDCEFNFSKTGCRATEEKKMAPSSVGQVFVSSTPQCKKIWIPVCPACLFASVCTEILGEISHSKWTGETFPFSLFSAPAEDCSAWEWGDRLNSWALLFSLTTIIALAPLPRLFPLLDMKGGETILSDLALKEIWYTRERENKLANQTVPQSC